MDGLDRQVLVDFGKSFQLDWKTGCWVWSGPRQNLMGHGQFKARIGGTRLAHRVSWLLHVGQIPKGMQVCHRCDVPACVNPNHLFLGTAADNLRDMRAKGRGYLQPKKTHCKAGHEFNSVNTFRRHNGTQGCKRCRSDVQLAYKERNTGAVQKYQRDRQRRIRAGVEK